MRWLRAADEFHLNSSTTANPQQIGAVLPLDAPQGGQGAVAERVLAHLTARIPASGLAVLLERSPWEIAPSWWRTLASVDLDRHLTVVPRLTLAELKARVATEVMQPVGWDQPPFRIVLVESLAEGGAALLLLVHHALVDGIGFQRIVMDLTDASPEPAVVGDLARRDEWRPPALLQLGRTASYLAGERRKVKAHEARVALAREQLRRFDADPANRQPDAPELSLNGPSSDRRSYDMVSLELSLVREVKRVLGGSVNDVFLTLAGGALRSYLLDLGLLPDSPLVALAARSHRREEDGDLGNFIVSLQPHIGTHIADPVARFWAVQESAARAIERSKLVEPLTLSPDKPFGARERRHKLAARSAKANGVFAANVALSNVPGPDRPRYLGGYRVLANYPTPIVGSRRFLNVTLRRYCEALDVGIMTDAQRIPDASVLTPYLTAALDELAVVAQSRTP
jgi:diacylglycerol O-acyltransferase